MTHSFLHDALPIYVYAEEGLFQRAADLASYFEDAIHALKGLPNVVDVRNLGMMAAVEVAPREGTHPTARSYDLFLNCWQNGVYTRFAGETLAFSPPLRSEEHTSELQSLMRTSYAVFCLKTKKHTKNKQ